MLTQIQISIINGLQIWFVGLDRERDSREIKRQRERKMEGELTISISKEHSNFFV